jgi:hypothetical protein
MADKIAGKIDSLEERLKKLKAQRTRANARKRSIDTRRNRREDTRRKILVGAIVLAKVEQGVLDQEVLRGWLDAGLTREDDRALFGLNRPAPQGSAAEESTDPAT